MNQVVEARQRGKKVNAPRINSFSKEIRQIDDKVRRDRLKARKTRQAWTPYRPFVNGGEMLGAVICPGFRTGRHRPRYCTKRSKYVSYSVNGGGRTVMCEPCLLRWLEFVSPSEDGLYQVVLGILSTKQNKPKGG